MSEQRGFTCDGGCGATTVVEAHESLQRARWFTVYGPHGWQTIHACSTGCLIKAVRGIAGRSIEAAQ